MHSLYCRLVVIQLLSFRDRIHKVSADMCPAGAPFDAGYLVIPLVTIGFQISLKAIQKVCCIVSAPCRGISVLVSLGLDLADASNRLSRYPADYLGLEDRGRLQAGAWADVVVLDPQLQVQEVFVEGEPIALR